MDIEPNPQDVEDHRWQALLRQPGVMAMLAARRAQADRQAYDQLNPPLTAGGYMGMPEFRLPIRRGEANAGLNVAEMAGGLALPGVVPALSRGLAGLQAIRHAYNAANESVYGPNAAVGYIGPGQRTYDSATQHGDADPLGPLLARLGYGSAAALEPHSVSLWDLLGGRH